MRRRVQFLTREEELALALRWRDSRDLLARDKLITSHMPLVEKMARTFARKSPGVEQDALVSEGVVGLMTAVDKFAPDLGFRLATYAQFWVKASIQDFLVRYASTVRGGLSSKDKREFFAGQRGMVVYSMNARLEEGGDEWGDSFIDEGALPDEMAEQAIDGERRSKALHGAVKRLKPRERSIIKGRFLSDEEVTLDTLGQRFGVSKERIRQIQNAELDKVREAMGAA